MQLTIDWIDSTGLNVIPLCTHTNQCFQSQLITSRGAGIGVEEMQICSKLNHEDSEVGPHLLCELKKKEAFLKRLDTSKCDKK